ncbi:MAG: molecular chaperone DnaJ [Deltaproteobacteria bacterium]|nr:MAG: molecular chaperone DnaJ [Deltaproteobacteria bacterium]
MSEKRCYYEQLGVEKSASTTEVRKAYKRLALKYHPDRNNGSDEATARFKEVTEAYSVLSDDDKRGRYDQFGHAGLEGSPDVGADVFSHFQDLFSDFFGGMGGFGDQRQRRGPTRGRDLRMGQRLTLEEAVLGCKKDLDLTSPVKCSLCDGTGAAEGAEPTACSTCNGSGQVSTGRGFIMFTQSCPSCQGAGAIITDPCPQCDGSGFEEKHRTVTVKFPAGIDAGHRLRVSGQGLPGTRGGPSGDLYVDVSLEPHERFEREGTALMTTAQVSFPDAALGTKVTIELLDGSSQTVKVDAGTQPGTVITVPRKGVRNVNGRGYGALHIVVKVVVPTRLSRRAKKLLRQLDDEVGPVDSATDRK